MTPHERLCLASALRHVVPGADLRLRARSDDSIVVGDHPVADIDPCACGEAAAACFAEELRCAEIARSHSDDLAGRRSMKWVPTLIVAMVVALAACGSDESASAPAGTDSSPSASAAATDQSTPETEGADASATATAQTEGSSSSSEFPVTIDHKFGSTTVVVEPTRVVSIGFNEHDFLLALGVVPIGLREWYGDQPNGVWPWAQDELGDATPEVLAADSLNFEQIASLQPDLIVGVWSGMSEEDYELLAAIAPTVAQPDTYEDYGTPWQEQTMILGRATGRTVEAEDVVNRIEEQFAAARDAHPEWSGLLASVAFLTDDGPGAYTSQDTRSRFMVDLGFAIPDANDSGADASFFLELSAEDLTPLDVDVLVWVYTSDAELEGILNQLPTRPALEAVVAGREVFADPELTGAFSHGSPLSLEFAIGALVPEIEAAVDGDPSTAVPSAVAAGATTRSTDVLRDADVDDGAGSDDARDAAAATWETVFNSTVAYVDKAVHLADAEELKSAVEQYGAAGETLGGIRLEPTRVAIDEERAEITYDVNFGDNTAYSGQTGMIALVDGVWTVSRDEFCAFMSSARVTCP